MMKIIYVITGLSLMVLAWYLFIRPYEYEVNFKAKTLPGDLIETIRIWDRSMDNAQIIRVDSFSMVEQVFVWNQRSYIYRWHFNVINDSTTDVNIKISQPNNSLKNKFLIPFTDQAIEQDAREISYNFYDILNEHLEITKVTVIGEHVLAPTFCVCRSLETKQIEKANGMMKDYDFLTEFISDHNLEVDGPPIVKVIGWNHSLGELKFDFCFPIKRNTYLPEHQHISYREFNSEKVLKANYNGNYITSDRAWYALIKHAELNGYTRIGQPIEYFYSNPTLGLNEKEWKAEVYLPIK